MASLRHGRCAPRALCALAVLALLAAAEADGGPGGVLALVPVVAGFALLLLGRYPGERTLARWQRRRGGPARPRLLP
ncbi:MAG: hypothetical protein HZB46_12350, partial [Solirubrobacterales bacterium]|nr:hypothetical protein [Solirubrobacterales bacterium]